MLLINVCEIFIYQYINTCRLFFRLGVGGYLPKTCSLSLRPTQRRPELIAAAGPAQQLLTSNYQWLRHQQTNTGCQRYIFVQAITLPVTYIVVVTCALVAGCGLVIAGFLFG